MGPRPVSWTWPDEARFEMRRVICWTVALLMVATAAGPAAAESGSPMVSESTEKQVASDVGAVIRHPPRPIVRQLRRVLPVLGDLPTGAIPVPRGLFAVPPCPGVRPAGPIPQAKAARAFFVGPDQTDAPRVPPGVLVGQVLAYPSPGQAGEALAAWFQETAIDCPRYRPDPPVGAEEGPSVVVRHRPIEAPVRLGQESRAIRTRAFLRPGTPRRTEVLDGIGVAFRQGRYLVFVESTGFFPVGRADPQPDLRLLRTTAALMFDRIEDLPGPVG
jgi:hypothetical protein